MATGNVRPAEMERITTPELAQKFIEEQVKELRAQIGDKKVLLALSGGVDSSVVAALLIKAVGKQLVSVHVNHGLLRKGEPEQVIKVFRDEMDANLVYVAKALRSIQQNDLPKLDAERRVLGIIRPTAEVIGSLTTSRHIGIFATEGTIKSESYKLEIQKLFPDIQVSGVACPFWVPLVEYNEADSPGADYFVKKYIDQLVRQDPDIDTVILGCTHYPLLLPKIHKYIPRGIRIVSQGEYVAESLQNYFERHPEIEQRCSKGGQSHYLTTENPDKFKEQAQLFLREPIEVENVTLG